MEHKRNIQPFNNFALTPANIMQPTAGEINQGWQAENRLPARKLNWCLQRNDELLQAGLQAACSNIVLGDLVLTSAAGYGIDVWVNPVTGVRETIVLVGSSGATLRFEGDSVPFIGRDLSTSSFAVFHHKCLCVTQTNYIIAAGRLGTTNLSIRIADSMEGSATVESHTNLTGGAFTTTVIRANNFNSRVVAASELGAIAYSDSDYTSAWSVVLGVSIDPIVDLKCVSASTWYAVDALGKVFRSVDNAANWSEITDLDSLGLFAAPGSFGSELQAVAVATPNDTDVIVMVTLRPSGVNTGWTRFAYSFNSGADWALSSGNQWPYQNGGSPYPDVFLGNIADCGGGILYAGRGSYDYAQSGCDRLFCSVDAGRNWKPCVNNVMETDTGLYNICFNGDRIQGQSDGVTITGPSL